jgi:ATP-dependent helicase/nuclease subunit B
MAVQFILGRSGTGKTSYCIKAIVNELLEAGGEQPLILLVPEQATYQAERAILTDTRIAGYHRLNVLSFDRLQFLLSGRHTARPALSRIGRQMIIHRILRESENKLKIFGPSASWTGLGRRMANTITELHQYAKTPDDIDRLLCELAKDESNNLTALKFTDIALIFKEYLNFIEGKFIDPDIQLTRACQSVSKAAFVKGAKLWVDGFAGFTTAELAILTELLKTVADVKIALCLDPSIIDLANPDTAKLDPVGIFSPTERTYITLVEIIKKCKLPQEKPVILGKPVRFSSSVQLAHIERNIFESKPKNMPAADNIRIVSAPNARAEIRFVARQILRLVKEKDYRFRDIAVIASDIDRYEHYIRAYFDDYDVPFFIDKRKSLNQHPVVQLISSALQIVAGGFSH